MAHPTLVTLPRPLILKVPRVSALPVAEWEDRAADTADLLQAWLRRRLADGCRRPVGVE